MSFKNVYIYVSDALRYDSIPDSIAEEGKVIPTLAPGGYTPICFSSLISGKDPRNHSVRSFYDTLEPGNVFDLFENHCYYDHPEDAMCRNVFRKYTTSKELEDMEEPFFYVERALDTHEPYGQVKHGNEIPDASREGTVEEGYREGVEATEEHFRSHVEKLKKLGLYEDTLIIFTSDHGELLGEKKVFRERTGHNKPMCRELNVVPTVFVNADVDFGRARTIDLVPTALSMIEGDRDFRADGYDLNSTGPDTAYSMLQINTRPLLTTGCNWYWRNGEWSPGKSKIKTDLATLFIDLINPLRKKARNSRLADFVRPDNADEYESLYERDDGDKELEDLDF